MEVEVEVEVEMEEKVVLSIASHIDEDVKVVTSL